MLLFLCAIVFVEWDCCQSRRRVMSSFLFMCFVRARATLAVAIRQKKILFVSVIYNIPQRGTFLAKIYNLQQ